jgi:hypothetical protein
MVARRFCLCGHSSLMHPMGAGSHFRKSCGVAMCSCVRFVPNPSFQELSQSVRYSGILCEFCRKSPNAQYIGRYGNLAACTVCYLSLGPALQKGFIHWKEISNSRPPNREETA